LRDYIREPATAAATAAPHAHHANQVKPKNLKIKKPKNGKNSQYAFFWAQMIRNKMKWTLQGAYRATAACDVSAVPLIIQQFYW